MTRGGGWWAGRGGGVVGKSEVCHFAIVSYLFSRHQDGPEGKARRKAANKWQQQAAAAATKTASKTRERESSDSPLTVAAAAVRTNQSINQSIGE